MQYYWYRVVHLGLITYFSFKYGGYQSKSENQQEHLIDQENIKKKCWDFLKNYPQYKTTTIQTLTWVLIKMFWAPEKVKEN